MIVDNNFKSPVRIALTSRKVTGLLFMHSPNYYLVEEMKQEKPLFMLPVTTRTNKRDGLNLCGRFTQMAGDLSRWQVIHPNRPSNIPFQADPFLKGEEKYR